MGSEPTRQRNNKTVSRSALRVVLFGMPEAGKSSLLGALAQAGESQQQALGGKLTDVSNGLAEMQDRLYGDSPAQTQAEVDPFPLIFLPSGGYQTEVMLLDCDGRVANELLQRRTQLGSGRRNSLDRSVLAADAIILAIDAAASTAQVEAEFSEFARFLRLLEQSRGEQAAVGGLPVFLVLTKCDLLARPEDGHAAWLDRIEERKQRVGERFRQFLERGVGYHTPFGTIHLHLWATAVKRPGLVDSAAQPREPYGVAELFRQAFEHARTFRSRRGQAGWRLFVTVVGALGAVAAMVGLAALLLFFRPGAPEKTELSREISRYQERVLNQTIEQQYSQARTKISDLTGFANQAQFAELDQAQQEYVKERLAELKAYLDFEQRLDRITSPAEVRSEKQLEEVKKLLEELTVPPQYVADFAQTSAGRRRSTYLNDVEAIRNEMDRVIVGYSNAINAGKKVLDERSAPMLPERAKKVIDDAAALPDRRSDLGKTIPGSKWITYATLLGIAEVDIVLQRWQKIRDDLEPSAKLAKP